MGAMETLAVREEKLNVCLPSTIHPGRHLLHISLPSSFHQYPDQRFPVLYLCDGYWNFDLVRALYANLIYDQLVPEFIIVGFSYQGTNPSFDDLRCRDYTPVLDPRPDSPYRETGGADVFLQVVVDEVIPFMEARYRASPFRVLGGGSFGGLFTLYAMLARPGLFAANIAASPAVRYAEEWLFGYEQSYSKCGALKARLYLTAAENEWPKHKDGVERFAHQLRERKYPDFDFQFRMIDDERHAGATAETYNRGIRFAFRPLVPERPWIAPGRPVE